MNFRDTLRGLFSPLSTVTASLGSLAILAVATRTGDFSGIAGFAAGSSVMALLALAGAGGSGILFATGDSQTRSAVWRLRTHLVTPSLLALSFGLYPVLAASGHVPAISALFGALSVAALNFQEMDTLTLQRSGKLHILFWTNLTSRALGALIGYVAGSYATGMLTAALASAAIFRAVNRTTFPETHVSFRACVRLSYRPGPMAMQLLDHGGLRWPLIATPLLFPPAQSGALSTVLQVWIAAVGVVAALPYTAMARQAAGRRVRDLQLLAVALAASISAALWMFRLHIATFLHLEVDSATVWLAIIAAAVFLRVITKTAQYRLAVQHRYMGAAIAIAPSAVAWIALLLVRDEITPQFVPYAIAGGELLSAALGTVLVMLSRQHAPHSLLLPTAPLRRSRAD